MTVAVAFESADVVPLVLVAVTCSRIVEPASACTTAYVVPVAPAMSTQFAPPVSHRRHFRVSVGVGVPVQVPSLPVNSCPTAAVPVIDGRTVFAGGTVITAVAADSAVTVLTVFVAVTLTRMVWPASPETST